jgi:outer membrane protein OmpA-like peptidoglycan-associated protein
MKFELIIVYYIINMFYSSNFIKAKIFALFFAVIALSAHAGEGNMNYYGQLGVHKTQSAQTLGHGRFGVGFFLEGATAMDFVKDKKFVKDKEFCKEEENPCIYKMTSYVGMNGYPFLSLGLSDIFDFSIGIPLYGEYLKTEDSKGEEKDLSAAGPGNLFISTKLRAPFGEKFPLDLALMIGFGISTGREDYGRVNDYGPWVHDPMFLGVGEDMKSPILAGEGKASTYTNTNSFAKLGIALTFDFGRIKANVPVLFHFNYAYRMSLGDSADLYSNIHSISAALEWTPIKFISLFGEYYNDMPIKNPANSNGTDLSTVSFGTSFHLGKTVDLQLGVQKFTGDPGKYIDNLTINMGNGERASYSARLIPNCIIFGGLTVKLFTTEQEYRNPDTDGDGVCDPWVAETGKQREFLNTCKGIDLCPYVPGPLENKGCPVETVESDVPVIIFTAMPDVVQKGESVTLRWQVTNATEVSIEGIGEVPVNGSKKVKPTENTTYVLTANGDGGTRNSTVEVEIASGPVPTIIFTASPESVQKGQTVTLRWQVTNATGVSMEGVGEVQAVGFRKVKPTENTTFTLTAVGDGGTHTATAEVEVAAGPLPSILFSANPETVQAGQPVTLKWQVTNATEVSIEGIGNVSYKGSKQVKPTESTVFTLTAVGDGGTQTETAEVEVTAAPVIEARVNLQGVTFGSGNATLTPNAKKVLDGVAEQLLANPKVKIEIQGHTDNQGKPAANKELSERRAKAVVGYLALKGVKSSRMSAVGFGQDVPIADNKTADGRELNRRIEMIRVDD